jgi:hypothetical protein
MIFLIINLNSIDVVQLKKPILIEVRFWKNIIFLNSFFPLSDDGGIYKGRLNNREHAREIDDTRDTKVDLPVDYREVETVDEENLYGNTGVCNLIDKQSF